MAKRRGRPPGSRNKTQGLPESIGTALGSVAAKLDRWMAQRNEITGELNAVIERAKGMLSSLEVAMPGLKPGRQAKPDQSVGATHETSTPTKAASAGRGAPRKRRKMSAAARKKISDAQKARWAKQKKAEK